MMKAWMRVLTVTLRQHSGLGIGKELKFGDNASKGKTDVAIKVIGHKYMSSLKDECKIEISNLTYSEITRIIDGKFYDVIVTCGYKNASTFDIFRGQVFYISTRQDDTNTNTVIILCTSKALAQFGQSRMNLTLNSGINLYSAIKYLTRRAGISKTSIDESLKNIVIDGKSATGKTGAATLEQWTTQNSTLIMNVDSASDSDITIFNGAYQNKRTIRLKASNIILSSFPEMTNEGLNLNLIPSFGFMCGDVIHLDESLNALIDISIESRSELSDGLPYRINTQGNYMIFQIQFNLENRGSQFQMQLLCKNRSLVSNFIGGVQ